MEPDAAALRALTDEVARFVCAHVATLAQQPASSLEGAVELAAAFREPAPEHGRPLAELLERLRPAIEASYNTAGPGYLAYIPGGGLYTAALAGLIGDAVNRYTGVRQAAPALVQIEETVLGWLAGELGYPAGAGGLLTSGGSLANLTAIVTAREQHLGEDVSGGVLYASGEVHHSVTKAARIAGLPAAAIRVVAVDARRRIVPAALEAAIAADRAAGRRPFLVVASAGTTNTGAIDPLPEVAAISRRHGLWLHADAAYGGFFRLAPEAAERLRGLEHCDSITLDPHKGLFLPYGTGCVLVRDREALRRAHHAGADYMQDLGGDTGFAELSPELSRRFRGLLLWLPIQLHGLAAFREQLREKLALAGRAARRLEADGRFELADEPQLSVVAFRLHDRDDAANAELLRRVVARKRVFLSSTRLDGRYWLRLCVLSFRTHRERVDAALDALCEEARALS
jgi:aromatic-L-amino-acid decarboxylase